MKLLNIIIKLSLLCSLFPLSTLANTWTISYDGVGIDSPKYVQETSDGGFIAAGSSHSPEGNGSNSYPYWLQKLDAEGNIVWQKNYGVRNHLGGSLHAITETADNGFILVGSIKVDSGRQNSFDLLKVNHSGDIIWQTSFGKEHKYPSSVIETSNGEIVVAGESRDVRSFQRWPWILKLNGNGDVISQKSYSVEVIDSRSMGTFRSIKETSDGGLVAAGYALNRNNNSNNALNLWVVKMDTNGNITWNNVYGSGLIGRNEIANAIVETSDGDFIVAGNANDYYDETSKAIILKLDKHGNRLWFKQSSASFGLASDVIEASDGGFIIAGSIYDNTWLLKMDDYGNPLWQKTYGKGHSSEGKSLGKTSDGGLIVASKINISSKLYPDFWVLKLDDEGNLPGCNVVEEVNNVILENLVAQRFSRHSEMTDMDMGECPEFPFCQAFPFDSADTDARVMGICDN